MSDRGEMTPPDGSDPTTEYDRVVEELGEAVGAGSVTRNEPVRAFHEHSITFRVPEELHVRLKVVAIKERRSLKEILNELTEDYVRKREAELDA